MKKIDVIERITLSVILYWQKYLIIADFLSIRSSVYDELNRFNMNSGDDDLADNITKSIMFQLNIE